jgi:protein TonB
MPNEKLLRLLLFVAVAGIHVILLLFLNFTIKTVILQAPENARIMRVTDFNEAPPLAPPPPPQRTEEPIPNQVEAIAEVMIETDEVPPDQVVVAPGTLIIPQIFVSDEPSFDDYLPAHKVARSPEFNEDDIRASLVYPPIALRSGIEGRVILELFVDRYGFIQQISILQETPKDRGFGDSAIKAFANKRAIPAISNEDGEPVSARYRYPVVFKIK